MHAEALQEQCEGYAALLRSDLAAATTTTSTTTASMAANDPPLSPSVTATRIKVRSFSFGRRKSTSSQPPGTEMAATGASAAAASSSSRAGAVHVAAGETVEPPTSGPGSDATSPAAPSSPVGTDAPGLPLVPQPVPLTAVHARSGSGGGSGSGSASPRAGAGLFGSLVGSAGSLAPMAEMAAMAGAPGPLAAPGVGLSDLYASVGAGSSGAAGGSNSTLSPTAVAGTPAAAGAAGAGAITSPAGGKLRAFSFGRRRSSAGTGGDGVTMLGQFGTDADAEAFYREICRRTKAFLVAERSALHERVSARVCVRESARVCVCVREKRGAHA
jgi:hypothetical protein